MARAGAGVLVHAYVLAGARATDQDCQLQAFDHAFVVIININVGHTYMHMIIHPPQVHHV